MYLSVLKFGGSVLRSTADLAVAVREVGRELDRTERVVVVVSAFGDTTDRLLETAAEIARTPDPGALAGLLSTGEIAAASLLTLALGEAGLSSELLDAEGAGIRTAGPLLDGRPVSLDLEAIRASLDRAPVLVVPGFVGRSEQGRVSVLGRGGSDVTALFLSQRLAAGRCHVFKDVDGVYERDPTGTGPPPRRFVRLSWEDALRLDPRVLPRKAVRFARGHGLVFEIGRPGGPEPTRVGPGPSVLERAAGKPTGPTLFPGGAGDAISEIH
jgi:homoserine dehydrogenase